MLIVGKRNNLKKVIDLLCILLWGFFSVLCIYMTILLIINIKWDNKSQPILGLLFLLFGTFLFSWLLYQWITKAISENFKIEFYNDYFIFKSYFLKRILRYDDIESIYIFTRGKYYTRGLIDILKIKSGTGKKVLISLDILNKKEKAVLKGIFKEKMGKKVRGKFSFWE